MKIKYLLFILLLSSKVSAMDNQNTVEDIDSDTHELLVVRETTCQENSECSSESHFTMPLWKQMSDEELIKRSKIFCSFGLTRRCGEWCKLSHVLTIFKAIKRIKV